MRQAIATIGNRAVGYINAHGTSTPAGDVTEVEAVRRVFGEDSMPRICGRLTLARGPDAITTERAKTGSRPSMVTFHSEESSCQVRSVTLCPNRKYWASSNLSIIESM